MENVADKKVNLTENLKEYHRQWRLKNPDKVRAANKKYALAHPAKVRAIHRVSSCRWQLENPTKSRAIKRRYYLNHKDKAREKGRRRRLRIPDEISKYYKEYRERYPVEYQARLAVQRALRNGSLVRQNCWCGEKGQSHHSDYSKPLQVTWLCSKHHGEAHRK